PNEPRPHLQSLTQTSKQNGQVVLGLGVSAINGQHVAQGALGGCPVAAFLKQNLAQQNAGSESLAIGDNVLQCPASTRELLALHLAPSAQPTNPALRDTLAFQFFKY